MREGVAAGEQNFLVVETTGSSVAILAIIWLRAHRGTGSGDWLRLRLERWLGKRRRHRFSPDSKCPTATQSSNFGSLRRSAAWRIAEGERETLLRLPCSGEASLSTEIADPCSPHRRPPGFE